jgi:universal stress protein E
MRPIRRILVAVKDTAAGVTPAIEKAAQLACALGARLELFHAITTPLYVDSYSFSPTEVPTVERSLLRQALDNLEKLATPLRRQHIQVNVSAEWDFPAYEAVVRRARQGKVDLVVADQHQKRHRVAGLLHLTDWELLRQCPVPVLLVKTPGTYRRPNILAALDPGHSFAKPASLDAQILGTASLVTQALRGKLHALHAFIPFPVVVDPDVLLDQRNIDRIQANTAASARAALDRAIRKTTIPKGRRHLIGRHPADAIIQVTNDIHSSLVVMGAISRSGFKRLLIGNTAERALDALDCDVLIVKPGVFATRVPRARRGVRVMANPPVPLPI